MRALADVKVFQCIVDTTEFKLVCFWLDCDRSLLDRNIVRWEVCMNSVLGREVFEVYVVSTFLQY
jgi:hypothetical protein